MFTRKNSESYEGRCKKCGDGATLVEQSNGKIVCDRCGYEQ